MTVAHTKHASGFDELEDHGKEFRSFRSEGSIRGHSERDEKSAVSLNDVSPSFPLPVFWRSLTMALSDRRAMVTCGVASVMNGA